MLKFENSASTFMEFRVKMTLIYMSINLTPVFKVKKKHTIQDLLKNHFRQYLKDPLRKLYLEPRHFEAVNKIKVCQSSKIGYFVFVCTDCGEVKEVHRSCKHRFCPTCGIADTYKWAEQTLSRLMNIKHHHITMTLPKPLRELSKMNGDKLHNILFKSSAKILKEWFEHRHNLRPGIVSVLHTAGADLKYHPHVHMIVSAGGQDLSTGKYRTLKNAFLVKQRFLGTQLKLKFGQALFEAYNNGELKMHTKIKDAAQLKKWFRNTSDKHWIVSIQDPLDDVEQIVKYVGRYTKRACVSEYKIENIDHKHVDLKYNDYKNTPRGEKPKEAIIRFTKTEFLDRLLQHVPTKRYRAVRYYGQYCSHYLNKIPLHLKLSARLELKDIQFDDAYDWGVFEAYRKNLLKLGKQDPLVCPHCQKDYILYGVFYDDPKKNVIFYEDP